MRVLLATTFLNCLSGSELFLFDAARGLRRRGHDVTVWVRDLAPAAPLVRLLSLDGIRVTSRLPADGSADAVVFQLKETFPVFAERHLGVPRLAVCHGPKLPAEVAPAWLEATTHLALTSEGRDWLVESGRKDVVHLGYGIDLDRFHPAGELPAAPRRALLHSKYADAGLVRAACERAGVELVEVGGESWRAGFGVDHFSDIVEVRDDGTVVDRAPHVAAFHVERRIADADIVFALGRSAVEALAMGRACVVFGYGDVGDGLVTPGRLERLAHVNFSGRAGGRRFDEASLAAELAGYDPAHGAVSRAFCERRYSLRRFLDGLEPLLHGDPSAVRRRRFRPLARRVA